MTYLLPPESVWICAWVEHTRGACYCMSLHDRVPRSVEQKVDLRGWLRAHVWHTWVRTHMGSWLSLHRVESALKALWHQHVYMLHAACV